MPLERPKLSDPPKKIRVEPLSKEDQDALGSLLRSEHEPITSDAICWPGPPKKEDRK